MIEYTWLKVSAIWEVASYNGNIPKGVYGIGICHHENYGRKGKFISSKVIGFNTVKDVVVKAWRPSFPLEVKWLEGNNFLFCFHHEADLHKAFRRRPWSNRGGHLILKKWSSDLAWQEVDFCLSSLWVQAHGLPSLWQSENNLKVIGSKVGTVIEVDFAGEGDSGRKRFTRIMVDVDISKPLIPGVFTSAKTKRPLD
nr:hypothetical protein CFP56_71638 [Quercus suber]